MGLALGRIGFTLIAIIAAALIVPPIVRLLLRAFLEVKLREEAALNWRQRVLLRYQRLDTYSWMFAYFKTRMDPMFGELPQLLRLAPPMRTILDVGCGFGVAGAALLEWTPDAEIFGVDPRANRVGVASAAWNPRGRAVQGAAPEIPFPKTPDRFDAIFFLDVVHYISDEGLKQTLERFHAKLTPGGYLFMRANIPPAGAGTLYWRIDSLLRKLAGEFARHRSIEELGALLAAVNFELKHDSISGGNPELHWFVARGRITASANESTRSAP